ncbi:MAG: hypothetical protein AAF512_14340 [Pseudomonadota bacterium]
MQKEKEQKNSGGPNALLKRAGIVILFFTVIGAICGALLGSIVETVFQGAAIGLIIGLFIAIDPITLLSIHKNTQKKSSNQKAKDNWMDTQ